MQPGKFSLQPAADSVRVVNQSRQHELDDRCSGALRKSLELALRGSGDSEFVAGFGFDHFGVRIERLFERPVLA